MYNNFVHLYNNGTLVREIKKILGITENQYRRFYNQGISSKDITPRRKYNPRENGKNYYQSKNGKWRVQKMRDNRPVYFGEFATEEMAKMAVKLFEELDWDRDYIWSVRRIVIEEFNYVGGK